MILRILLLLPLLATPLFGNTPDLFASSAKPNGTVHGIAQQSTGRIVVVGAFTKAGSFTRNRIARYRINGSLDYSLSPGDGANGTIHHVAVTDDDRIVIAGAFTTYQGHDARHAAVLSANGTFERALSMPSKVYAVHALAVAGGTAYIGGDFTGYFRHINLLGGYSLSKPSGSPNAPVNAIVVEDVPNGPFITLGGDFTRIGSTNVGYIAHLDRHARLTPASTEYSGANGRVTALGIAASGDPFPSTPAMIVVGGEFTQFNGSFRSRLATIYSANTRFASPVPGQLTGSLGQFMPAIFGNIVALQPRLDGTVAVGGIFNVSPGGYTNLAFSSLLSGGFGIGSQSDHRPDGAVHALCQQGDGMLLIGGEFSTMDNLTRPKLTRLYGPGGTSAPGAPVMKTATALDDGSIYLSWNPSSTNYLQHYSIQREVILGNWSEVGTVSSDRDWFIHDGLSDDTSYKYRVLAVSGTGSTPGSTRSATTQSSPALGTAEPVFDTSQNPSSSIQSVNRISVDAKGRILATSDYGHLVAESDPLYRLLPSGLLDTTFTCSFRWGAVEALTCLPDGKTMIAGEFLHVNEQARNYLARILEDGALDPGFSPVLDAPVRSVLPMTDGSYLIAGSFTSINGESRTAIARLDGNGQVDPQFSVSIDGYSITAASRIRQALSGAIYVTASILPDGGGDPETSVLKIDEAGVPDPTFSLPATLEVDQLQQFELGPDDKLYLAGRLWPLPKPAGFLDTRLVRLLADGSMDPSFSDDGYSPPYLRVSSLLGGSTPDITALITPADGKAITTGEYNFFDGSPRFGIARHTIGGERDGEFIGGTGPQAISSWREDGFYYLPIEDFATLPDGTVVAGGTFLGINGVERKRLASLYSGPYTAPPVAPSTPVVTPRGNQRLFVSWNPVAHMTGYIIERQLTGQASYTEIARVPSGWRHYVDTVDHGTSASYQIRSISGTDTSAPSGSASGIAISPFVTWKESHGLPSDADPDSDSDGDGLPLLIEYALQRNPGAVDTEPWFSLLDKNTITVSIHRDDVVYIIESSENLSDWDVAGSAAGAPGGILALPITTAEDPTLYFRLRVLPQ